MSVPTVISYRIKFIVFPKGLNNTSADRDVAVGVLLMDACEHKSHTVPDLKAYTVLYYIILLYRSKWPSCVPVGILNGSKSAPVEILSYNNILVLLCTINAAVTAVDFFPRSTRNVCPIPVTSGG